MANQPTMSLRFLWVENEKYLIWNSGANNLKEAQAKCDIP